MVLQSVTYTFVCGPLKIKETALEIVGISVTRAGRVYGTAGVRAVFGRSGACGHAAGHKRGAAAFGVAWVAPLPAGRVRFRPQIVEIVLAIGHRIERTEWTRPTAAPVLRSFFQLPALSPVGQKFSHVRSAECQGESWRTRPAPWRPLPPVTGADTGQATPHTRILLSTGQLPRTQKAYRYYDTTTMPDPRAVFPLALEVLIVRGFNAIRL
jgi:hypothetical protein